ncbi:MAG: NAD(P)-dependent alcohol dehydrogenase [Acidimicrobiia bacterium]|nr:NAD(P)-dependent alcohol dehydrogenase [Acidimicrobiia bacterium]
MLVRGYAAHSSTSPLAPFGFERRTPGAHDVQIAIDYCGICHSDIHTARNDWQNAIYPCVPGHEIVGTVMATGPAVTRFTVGDRVGVGCFVGSCRQCDRCTRDLESYCLKGPVLTYGSLEPGSTTPTHGGYSSGIVVDEHFVLRIPATLDPAAAAPLLCAGITTWSPLRHVGLSPGDSLAIVGFGGLGHMAVKLGVSLGAEVTVISRSERKAADALRMGAHDVVAVSGARSLARHADRFDVVLDTVSAVHDIDALLGCLKADGTMVLVGAPPATLDLSPFTLILRRRRLMGSLVGGLRETREMLDHCGAHGITSDIEHVNPDGINAAWDRVVSGDVRYRFVIDCRKF